MTTKQGLRVSENSKVSNTSDYQSANKLLHTPDIDNTWLLPDGVSDLFSDEAQKQEWLRYTLTKRLIKRGYQLICPPMIEFTESLLGNASEDLKRRTFKIIDQLSGRLMGVRADITPQILRIDAHLVKLGKATPVSRYCYAGHVIRTLPDGLFGSRTPLQLGAEIFGCGSLDADIELLDVLFCLLDSLDIKKHLHIDVGHVAIFARLKELANLPARDTAALIELYANKALPELKRVCASLPMGEDFYQLAVSGHDVNVLKQNLSATASCDAIINEAIQDVQLIVTHIKEAHQADVSVDITELGFHYHTGIVFNAYFDNESQAVVRGGRFNSQHDPKHKMHGTEQIAKPSSQNLFNSDVQVQRQTREATGFSLDVSRLQRYITLEPVSLVLVNYADLQDIKQLKSAQSLKDSLDVKIEQLRASHYQVIRPISMDDIPSDRTHQLGLINDEWVLQTV